MPKEPNTMSLPSVGHDALTAAFRESLSERRSIDSDLDQVYEKLLLGFPRKGQKMYADVTNRTAATLLQRTAKRVWSLATVDNLANFTLSIPGANPVEKRTELEAKLHEAGDTISKFLGRTNLNVEGPQHVLQMITTGTSLLVGKRVPENRNRFTFFCKDRRDFVVLSSLKDSEYKVYSNLLHEPVIWTETLEADQVKALYPDCPLDSKDKKKVEIHTCYFATYEEKGEKDQKFLAPRYFIYIFSDELKDEALSYKEISEPMIIVKSNYFSRENSPYGYGRAEEFLAEADFLDKLDRLTIETAERQAKPVIIAPEGSLSTAAEPPGAHSELRTFDADSTPIRPFVIPADNAHPLHVVMQEREAKLVQAEGSDLPTQEDLSRHMTATEWADRRRTANQILSQTIQIVVQNVFYPLAGQTLAALQLDGSIDSYIDEDKKIPLNLLDGDDIEVHWNNALEQLKQGIELDRHVQLDNFVLNKLRTGQITPEAVQAVVDPIKTLAYGFKMHNLKEELWRSPEEIKREQEQQERDADALLAAQQQGGQIPPVQTTPPIQQTPGAQV